VAPTADAINGIDQEFADFVGELIKVLVGECAEVGRLLDAIQQTAQWRLLQRSLQ
jgi:hypothetical protein